jgi:hypothetical protein
MPLRCTANQRTVGSSFFHPLATDASNTPEEISTPE